MNVDKMVGAVTVGAALLVGAYLYGYDAGYKDSPVPEDTSKAACRLPKTKCVARRELENGRQECIKWVRT